MKYNLEDKSRENPFFRWAPKPLKNKIVQYSLLLSLSIPFIVGCGGGGSSSGGDDPKPNPKPPVISQPVIFQLDDLQAWWLEDTAERLVEAHIDKEVPVTLGVVPVDLHYREGDADGLTEKLKIWHKDNRNLVEIGLHTIKHDDYAEWELPRQKRDIEEGLSAFNDLGINKLTTFVPANSWGNEHTPQAIDAAGLYIGMDGLENPYIDSTKNPMILEDGIWHGKDFNDWDFAALEDRLDKRIEKRGYVLISYHQQDFDGALDADFEKFGDFLQDLKDSGKYKVMTSKQYYEHLNGSSSNPNCINISASEIP